MGNIFDDNNDAINTYLKNKGAKPEQGYLTGAVSSFLSGISEGFGAKPLPGVEDFRAENPVGGIVSEFGGAVAPAIATMRAAETIPAFKKFVEKQASKGSNAFTQGARRGLATFAPLEGAKLASTALVNPENLSEVASNAGFNLAIETIGGGVLGALGAGGKIAREIPKDLGDDLRQPKQLELRKLRKRLMDEALEPKVKDEIQRKMSELDADIRLESVGDKSLKFDFIDGDASGIRRLFKDSTSKKGNVIKRKLAVASGGFEDPADVRRVIEQAGLKDKMDLVSLPRYIGFKRKNDAAKVQGDFLRRGKFQTLDDKTLLSKTKDGTYIMAKKITGDLKKADQNDEWVVWRTAQPSAFSKETAEFADKVNEMLMMQRTGERFEIKKGASSILMDEAKQAVKNSPIKEYRAAVESYGLGKKTTDKILDSLGWEKGTIKDSFAFQRGKAFVEHYITPALYQFKDPRSGYIWAHARRINDKAKLMTQRLLHGEAKSSDAKTFAKVFEDPRFTGALELDGKKLQAIKPALDKLSQEDLAKFTEVAEIIAGGEDASKAIRKLYAEGEISKGLKDFMENINEIDKFLVKEIRGTQKAAGDITLNPLEGHLMLSRVWEGDYRAPIYNQEGQIVYVASGKTPPAANQHAEEVIKASGLQGLRYDKADKMDAWADIRLADRINSASDEYAVLARANTQRVRKPLTYKERKGVGGYKSRYTKAELLDRISSHISERMNHMAQLSINTALDKELAELYEVDPKKFATLTTRLRDLADRPGTFSTAVNKATDAVLKPVLGRNSATKISATVNEFFYHTQLGMGNLAFPVLNALTFIQTVMPEIAYVTRAGANRVMRDYYEVAIMGGSDLKPRGGVHYLSPIKMMMRSVREMKEGNPVLNAHMDQAIREGVIDPQLLQEFIGKTAEMNTKISDVLAGEDSFVNFIRTISSYLPSKSERFARGHAFTVGHLVGRDLLGLQDEALYTFSKKFTERTMYNYATADRAEVMTGAVGRMFGLFKNWQTHYFFSMMQYANEGLKYGNWSPLLWQMAGTSMVGGVTALPLYSVADKFAKMAGNESIMTQVYEGFGGTNPDGMTGEISDAVLFGLPNFLGVSLSTNASAPFNDPSRDAAQLMSFPQWRRMTMLGQAVGDSVDYFGSTGQHPIQSEEIRNKFIIALSPKVLARTMQMTDESAVQSLTTGKVVLKDLSLAERMLFQVGFTPRRLGVAYEAADELWKSQRKRKEMTKKYGRWWYEAQENKNWDELWNLQQRAMVLGLDISSIIRSADGFREKAGLEQIERQFSPESRAKLQALGLPGF